MHIIMHFNFLCEAFRSFLVFFFLNIVSNAMLYIFMGEVLSAHLINSVLISLEIEEMGKQFEEAFIRQDMQMAIAHKKLYIIITHHRNAHSNHNEIM